MKLDFVLYEKRDRIAYVTIDRSKVMNAVHPPCGAELAQVWDDFAADGDLRAAILTGAGTKAFCAGVDLRYVTENPKNPRPHVKGGFAGLTARFDIHKPIIATVNGYALGGGFELALACDLIIAAEHAVFGLTEPKRGFIASAGGVHRLPRQLPLKLAMELLLTGRTIDAHRAMAIGLVNEVVPASKLIETATSIAREIVDSAPLSITATKQIAMHGLEMSLEEAVTGHWPAQSQVYASEDGAEGARAFVEKRKPVWRGR